NGPGSAAHRFAVLHAAPRPGHRKLLQGQKSEQVFQAIGFAGEIVPLCVMAGRSPGQPLKVFRGWGVPVPRQLAPACHM
ncbi:MAG: hypothetical protein AB7K35_08455, partial [Pseudorhodoplanes sp.]